MTHSRHSQIQRIQEKQYNVEISREVGECYLRRLTEPGSTYRPAPIIQVPSISVT
jgi:hypothetical protein